MLISGKKEMKILLTEPLITPVDDSGLRILAQVGKVTIASSAREDDLKREVEDADAVVVRLAKITSRIIENARRLKVIARTGAGVDNIDIAAASRKGIMVVNTASTNTLSVAEHTICLILASAKNLTRFDTEVRKGNWSIRDALLANNLDLTGKVLGIVGAGKIGYAVATRAVALGMKVLFYDVVPRPDVEGLGGKSVNLDTLLREADFVTIHVPLIRETRHLFDDAKLKIMKHTAYLINTSRGEVVDQKALFNALRNRLISGAALDVFENEPIDKDDPILKLENIIVTPHVAGHTRESRAMMISLLAEDVVRALNGNVPVNLVNREVLN